MPQIPVEAVYENTTMEAYYNTSNELVSYFIIPNEGYVLHDNSYDFEVLDEETLQPTGEIKLGYIDYSVNVYHNYDFTANPRQIYAVLKSSVPADQIFNNGGNYEKE